VQNIPLEAVLNIVVGKCADAAMGNSGRGGKTFLRVEGKEITVITRGSEPSLSRKDLARAVGAQVTEGMVTE